MNHHLFLFVIIYGMPDILMNIHWNNMGGPKEFLFKSVAFSFLFLFTWQEI